MWETRNGEALKGKILLLLPDGVDQDLINTAFFGADVLNSLALERLVLRGRIQLASATGGLIPKNT